MLKPGFIIIIIIDFFIICSSLWAHFSSPPPHTITIEMDSLRTVAVFFVCFFIPNRVQIKNTFFIGNRKTDERVVWYNIKCNVDHGCMSLSPLPRGPAHAYSLCQMAMRTCHYSPITFEMWQHNLIRSDV